MDYGQFIPKKPTEVKDKIVSLRVTYPEHQKVSKAARRVGKSVTEWSRAILLKAAEEDLDKQ